MTGVLADVLRVVTESSGYSLSVLADADAAEHAVELVGGERVIIADRSDSPSLQGNPGGLVVVPTWFGRHHAPEGSPRALSVAISTAPEILYVVVPEGALRDNRREPMLGPIWAGWSPELVVSGGVLRSSSMASLRVALVGLVPDENFGGIVRFFRLPPPDGGAEAHAAAIADFRRLLARRGGTTEFGFVHRGSIHGLPWDQDRYDPALAERLSDLQALGQVTTVDAVFVSIWPSRRTMTEVGPEVPILRGSDFSTQSNTLSPISVAQQRAADGDDEHRRGTDDLPRGLLLEAGDILVPRVIGSAGRARAAAVLEEMLPLAASNSVLVLRPRRPLPNVHVRYYEAYFSSRRAVDLAEKSVLGGRVMLRNLRAAPLPIPDDDLVDALEQIDAARAALSSWLEDASEVDSQIFDTSSAAESRASLLERGRLLRQRIEAGGRVETLGYRVSQFYPFPIAGRWRTAEVEFAAGRWAKAYRAVLDCFESLVTFAALLTLAIVSSRNLRLGSASDLAKKLAERGHGISLGDWVQLLTEVATSRVVRDLPDDDVLVMLGRGFDASEATRDARVRLTARRNDEAHGRAVVDHELEAETRGARRELETVVESLAVLADCRVVQVERNEWDSIEGRGLAHAEALVGDHPVGTTLSAAHDLAGLEVGSLYLIAPNGGWHLLRPFLVRRTCPECGVKSVYFPDRGTLQGLEFKPLEHGHNTAVIMDESRVALASVGFFTEEQAGRLAPGPEEER
ncbi:hypothetical protein QQX13_00175 [Demequina sp. SYSU T00068]|uniref:hypothetical protein n=1 Tax=Demequina lignilytica TaxID=3051663 RepID=UPI00261F9EB6|nr:hypothetical protein [Demequina sp. SYSU T00068]MDN4489239.1 hypothetical protein [Demequina sp. SYSU T00068]